MYIKIYPYNIDTLEALDTINILINQYNQCVNYNDLFLGTGLVFNNLTKKFKKYTLNDYNPNNTNFYKLLKNQLPDFLISQIEEVWRNYDVGDLMQIYLQEKNAFKKCIEKYVLENKVSDKDTLLEYFPKKELLYVMDKLKKNDILFKVDTIINFISKLNLNDLLFVNLDNIKEEYHRKLLNWVIRVCNAVIIIYSSIGCNYLNMLEKYCDTCERVCGTGFIYCIDNKISKDWY